MVHKNDFRQNLYLLRENKLGGFYFIGKPTDIRKVYETRKIYEQTQSIRKTAKLVRLSVGCVAKLVNRLPILNGRNKDPTVNLIIQWIAAVSKLFPLKTHIEIQQLMKQTLCKELSISRIAAIRHDILFLRRKRVSYIEKKRKTPAIKLLRNAFREHIQIYDPCKLIFLDESHFSYHTIERKYGYYGKGIQAIADEQQLNTVSYSLLMAQSSERIYTKYIKNTEKEGVNSNDFGIFLDQLFLDIPNDSIIVLDNARLHKTKEIKRKLKNSGYLYVFLSPYSPDMSPIELSFGLIKSYLRLHYFDSSISLFDMICNAINMIQPTHLNNFMYHCQQNWLNTKDML